MMEQLVKMIDFEEGQILGVKDENAQVWMGIKKACLDIGLSDGQARRQVENIQKDKVLKEGVANLRYPTNGGIQEVWCIQEELVTLWLAKISITPTMERENPVAVDRLVKYQRKAAKVLHEAFMGAEEKKQQFYNEMGIQGIIVDAIKQEITPIKNELHIVKTELNDMKNSILFKQNINPRYILERLIPEYFEAINQEVFKRHFYDALGNYMGTAIPYGKNLPNGVEVRDYVLSICDIEAIKEFVFGVRSGRIVQSKQGNWIDLQGIFANKTEKEKIYREFNYECAYCGSKNNLVVEHLKSQVKYSEEHPERVDLIHNCVIACDVCNGLKKKQNVKEWYIPSLSFYSEDRKNKIKKHWSMYLPNAETLNKIKIA